MGVSPYKNEFRFKAAVAAISGLLLAACGGGEPASDEASANIEPEASTPEAATASSPTALIDEASLRARIKTLSSDEFEGRAPATPGGARTRDFLTEEMKKIGLAPSVGDSYEQPVPLVEVTADPDRSAFAVNSAPLEYGTDVVFWTKRVVEEVSFDDSEMVFVGYGVVAPEYGWNDYEGLDVAGKTVVMLINDPGFANPEGERFNGKAMTYYGRWTYKYEEAARQGAAAAVIVHQTAPAAYPWGVIRGWTGPQLDLERPDGGAGRVAMEAWISEGAATQMFEEPGLSFADLAAAAAEPGFKPQKIGDLRASGQIVNTIRRETSANVVGVIPGAERPDEYVLYMAHWDHLGVDKRAESGVDAISNGAVDNATGTAGILSIAEAFMKSGETPKRSVMFVEVTAEESGLLGSGYFAESPLAPLEQIVGGVNIDAMLPAPLSKDLMVIGFGASELEDVLKAAADERGRYLRPDPEPEKGFFYRSDHISLAKKGVPMLYADSGVDLIEGGEAAGRAIAADYVANKYHKPADEYSDDWDMSGMIASLELLYEVGATLANSDQWPNWYEGNEFRAVRDAQRASAGE